MQSMTVSSPWCPDPWVQGGGRSWACFVCQGRDWTPKRSGVQVMQQAEGLLCSGLSNRDVKTPVLLAVTAYAGSMGGDVHEAGKCW